MKRIVTLLLLLCLATICQAQMPRSKRDINNTSDIREFLRSARFTRTVTVDAGGRGDFRTLAAASSYVAAQSPTAEKPWTIVVYGGPDNQDGVVIPSFVTVT